MRGIRLRQKRHDGQPEDATDHTPSPACRLPPTALFDAQEEIEDLGRCDRRDRSLAERLGAVFKQPTLLRERGLGGATLLHPFEEFSGDEAESGTGSGDRRNLLLPPLLTCARTLRQQPLGVVSPAAGVR